PGIMPPLNRREAVEVTSIASCVGMPPAGAGLLEVPPFRAPHHSISPAALVGGGGAAPRPGEVTRAHRGGLFMGEITEFRRDALEALRQPLEEGRLAVARSRGHAVLPARFILVAESHRGPCASSAEPRRPCACPTQRWRPSGRRRRSRPTSGASAPDGRPTGASALPAPSRISRSAPTARRRTWPRRCSTAKADESRLARRSRLSGAAQANP